ncbi:MAG: HD domain-containing protein [Candidatus Kuenenia sp.]|nr:HD domain-containing protein [Candidatus Kuenenia hertensis]
MKAFITIKLFYVVLQIFYFKNQYQGKTMSKESRISLFDLTTGLSEAVDLINPVLVNHHMQVAYIAFSISEELGLTMEEKSDLVLAGALHDIGCYCLAERMDLLKFEVETSHEHEELGYLFLHEFKPFSFIANLVRFHHVRWDKKNKIQRTKKKVPYGSYILHIADRVSVMINKQEEILGQANGICEKIKVQSGKMFMPELVDAFLKLAEKEYFWLEVTSSVISVILSARVKMPSISLDMEHLISFSKLFSRIVDFRSAFFATHSTGVAASAQKLANFAGFSKQECQWMEIAGYVHDIGMLVVPIEILEKEEPLSEEEFSIIRKHPFYTNRILKRIAAFKCIISWASYHHETLSGTGYPFHVKEDNLQLGARILAVANVFSTLTELRPYRKKLSNETIQEELKKMGEELKLDPHIVSILLLHFNEINSARIAAQDQAKEEYLKIEYILMHPEQ